MAEKISHIIEVRAVGEDGSILKKDPHDPTFTNEKDSPIPKKKIKESLNRTIALKMGAQAATYAVSNYGALTGDTIGQQHINDVASIGGMLALAVSSPLGAGLAVSQLGITGVNRLLDVGASRRASITMRERLGITSGGSR